MIAWKPKAKENYRGKGKSSEDSYGPGLVSNVFPVSIKSTEKKKIFKNQNAPETTIRHSFGVSDYFEVEVCIVFRFRSPEETEGMPLMIRAHRDELKSRQKQHVFGAA